jgi:hypothetical protein
MITVQMTTYIKSLVIFFNIERRLRECYDMRESCPKCGREHLMKECKGIDFLPSRLALNKEFTNFSDDD